MLCPTKLENITIEYFQARGRAEPIRLLLEDHGIQYAETSIKRETWAEDKLVYDKYPFSQVPVLHVNGEIVAQQDAILRYITKVLGVTPLSFKDETITDMLAISIEDFYRLYPSNSLPDYVEKVKVFLTTAVPKVFGQYEHLLNRLPTANPPAFVEGPHPCFPEYKLFSHIEAITTLEASALDGTPRLKAWFVAFGERKGIAAYIASGRRAPLFPSKANDGLLKKRV